MGTWTGPRQTLVCPSELHRYMLVVGGPKVTRTHVGGPGCVGPSQWERGAWGSSLGEQLYHTCFIPESQSTAPAPYPHSGTPAARPSHATTPTRHAVPLA